MQWLRLADALQRNTAAIVAWKVAVQWRIHARSLMHKVDVLFPATCTKLLL